MKRVGLGIGAALILFAVGFGFARGERARHGDGGGMTTDFSTTYTIWSVDPSRRGNAPSPLDGSDLADAPG